MAELLEEIEKWSKSLKCPTNESVLYHEFKARFAAAVLAHPQPSSFNLEQEEARTFWQVHLANVELIKKEIIDTCNKKKSDFTSSEAFRKIPKTFPSHCFQHITLFRATVESCVQEVTDRYFAIDSPYRAQITLSEFIFKYESELIDNFKSAKIEDFAILDACVESLAVMPQITDTEPHEMDQRLTAEFVKVAEDIRSSLSELTEGHLPTSLHLKYESDLRDRFISHGKSLMDASLNRVQGMMYDMVTALISERNNFVLFDDRMTDITMREIILIACQVVISKDQLVEEIDSLMLLAEAMKLQSDFFMCYEEFKEGINNFRRVVRPDQRDFIAVSILFVLTRVAFSAIPSLHREIQPRYPPSARMFYRQVLSQLFRTEDQTLLFSINEWYLGCCAEIVLSYCLQSIQSPLVSHVPDQLLEEMCQYGGHDAYSKVEATPGGPESTGVKGFVLRTASSVLQLLPLAQQDPSKKVTFVWKSLKEVMGMSTLIVISGWHSEDSDYESDWKGVVEGELQGPTLGLRWDADTTYSAALGTILTTIPTLPFGYISAALGLISGSVQVFSSACKRSKRVGKLLAQTIAINGCGQGPVTLMGFSLGARVVYNCLKELRAKYQGYRVLDVILLGGAITSVTEKWGKVREVVQGRLVNVYSRNDFVLSGFYHYAMKETDPIGTTPIDVEGVENFDATSYVMGHQDHRKKLKETLEFISYKP